MDYTDGAPNAKACENLSDSLFAEVRDGLDDDQPTVGNDCGREIIGR